jgi:hypothetical protein
MVQHAWRSSHRGAGRGSRINLPGCCHASYGEHAIWNLINVDTHGHPLCKTHPGEDRICRREPCLVRLCVREVDATSDANDMATNELAAGDRSDGLLDRLGILPKLVSAKQASIQKESASTREDTQEEVHHSAAHLALAYTLTA